MWCAWTSIFMSKLLYQGPSYRPTKSELYPDHRGSAGDGAETG